uniref:ZP domain-containing protein n=1 Tax=Mola mola TaxID=94237 RepID=A0A3Q3XC92_MOLML
DLLGFAETVVQSECRDRYFWIHVASGETPRFEAVDGNGVHFLSEQLASHCGYTISTFNMDGFSTFRASYYSCFTLNQNDEVFTFRFNVLVNDGSGQWISRPVSAVCSGLTWTHRDVKLMFSFNYLVCKVFCVVQAQKTASSVWQLMFLHSDGQVSSMSISEAQKLGYSLAASPQRVVLRSWYKQPQAEVKMVEGIPVEAVRVSLFFKQKLMVLMIDVADTVFLNSTSDSGSFDGGWLLWDVPQVVSPLVGEGAGFESRSLRLGVEGVLLDESTIAARGFSMVQRGHLIQIGVPFGAEGGYRKSLVVNNTYKEMYVIFLMYEHVFSLLYEDGSSIDTRHRILRVLDTPLLCHPPFKTMSDDQVFSIYLGNIPSDVLLDKVWINGKQLRVSDGAERGFTISPVVHANGSRAYELRLPFEDPIVHQTYLGHGVVQYSVDINFTLAIMPQRDPYYHNTFITAQVFNAFPPEITAQCSDKGIAFSVVGPPQTRSLWEVGVDHEPLTSQLAAERGYILYNDTQRTSLEVPVFSIGYTYEDINLSNFYGTFNLLLRDSKTLEVQTSTSKRCLFKTQDMIICSTDGTMTVVTTLASTWPTVHSERTTLLDPACGPKQMDSSRVLFEFKLDSCGTRAKVRIKVALLMIPLCLNRLTVRCFYPLSGVNRLSVDRIFKSDIPGFGSVNIFKSLKGSRRNRLTIQI